MSGSCLHGAPVGWHCPACEQRRKRLTRRSPDPKTAHIAELYARIADLERQLAALPSMGRILEYQRASEALRDAVGIDDQAAIPDRYMDLDLLPPLTPDDGA